MNRTHRTIIRDAGGPAAVARLVHASLAVPQKKATERVKAWVRLDSIPPEYWPALVEATVATLGELTAAAEAAKFPEAAMARADSAVAA